MPDGNVDTKSTHTFAHQGGTIGRGPDNEWTIEDSECFISSQHSRITYENGQYYITDLSTNGTFFNGLPEPIGKGNTIQLNDGDKFSLGDYEFLASVWQPGQHKDNLSQGPFSSTTTTSTAENSQDVDSSEEYDYFSSAVSSTIDDFATPLSGHVSNTDSLFSLDQMETDPLAALDNARLLPESNSFQNNPTFGLSQTDQADPMQQSVNWPNSTLESGTIPEDWDLNNDHNKVDNASFINNEEIEFTKKSSTDKKTALEKANEKILAEIEILKKQAQKQALKQQIEKNTRTSSISNNKVNLKRSTTNNEQSLIEALGLDNKNLSDEKIIEINKIVGELVRETIMGMMQVLSSRSTIKNEFRMNVTTIQPVENNPLKFSANVDDAIENMFIKDGNAYKKPVEAIKEGFEGIAEHQIAILAGIRTAFKSVLTRFDPMILEQRFEQFNKSGIIPGMTKAKNWDSYKSYYQELVDDMDNSFQHLFGYEFVQAYEEQLQKLSVARKTKV
jgi:type VI secretion system FHA domain protein